MYPTCPSVYRMQNPQIYRQWKEAATEQQRTALASTSFYWKVAKWLFLIAMVAGAIAPIKEAASAHSSTIATSCRSAAEALFPLVPYGQTYGTEDAVNMPTTTVPDQPFANNLFPEIKQAVAAMDGSAHPQQAHHNDGNHSMLLLGPVLDSRGGSRTIWALEDSLLRAAELECDLASIKEEHQQLSAHLLQAARQLAAVGQPVQLPEAQPAKHVQELYPINTALFGMLLLLMLTWTLWRLLVSANRDPNTAEQLAPCADSATEEVGLSDQSCQNPIVKMFVLPAKLRHNISQPWQDMLDKLIQKDFWSPRNLHTSLGFHQHAVQTVQADITQPHPPVMKALACSVDAKSQGCEATHYLPASIKIEPSMGMMTLMSVLQATSLQQHNSKLERQVQQQQQQLRHAEQSIMGLTSSKVHAPCSFDS